MLELGPVQRSGSVQQGVMLVAASSLTTLQGCFLGAILLIVVFQTTEAKEPKPDLVDPFLGRPLEELRTGGHIMA